MFIFYDFTKCVVILSIGKDKFLIGIIIIIILYFLNKLLCLLKISFLCFFSSSFIVSSYKDNYYCVIGFSINIPYVIYSAEQ